jgi:hypothetical protein
MTVQTSFERQVGFHQNNRREIYDAELEPFKSLFLKPLSKRKARFTKQELEVMCRDPHHSPELILYLIDCIKAM